VQLAEPYDCRILVHFTMMLSGRHRKNVYDLRSKPQVVPTGGRPTVSPNVHRQSFAHIPCPSRQQPSRHSLVLRFTCTPSFFFLNVADCGSTDQPKSLASDIWWCSPQNTTCAQQSITLGSIGLRDGSLPTDMFGGTMVKSIGEDLNRKEN